jgi:hypothetical protein
VIPLLLLAVEADAHVDPLVVHGRGADGDRLDLAGLEIDADRHDRPIVELALHLLLLPTLVLRRL